MKYFTDKELACKCYECSALMDPEFMEKLISLRERCAFPFKLTSAVRCSSHNTSVGGSSKSMHLRGRAVDILLHSSRAYEVISLAKEYGLNGVGISQKGAFESRFIHLDDREKLALWSY